MVAECYLRIFITGFFGPKEKYQHSDAKKLGDQIACESAPHFEENPGLTFIITSLIQQDCYAIALHHFLSALKGADFSVQAYHGNCLLAEILLADRSNTDIMAKLSGMVMHFGQLNLYVKVILRHNGVAMG